MLSPSPVSQSDLWLHMPSSPPEPFSSPSAEKHRISRAHMDVKSRKSLEWACAKAREDRRQWRGKENRAPKAVHSTRRARMEPIDVERDGEGSDTEVEPDEAITPALSAASIGGSGVFRMGSLKHLLPTGGSQNVQDDEDVEAAMVLLRFSKRQ